jgi:hypothetical protein
MNKAMLKFLYFLVVIVFASSILVSMIALDEETGIYYFQFLDFSQEVSERLYNTILFIATAFTSGTLLVLINLYNATNKDRAISEGSLDAKQNQTLANEISTMNALDYLLETSNLGTQEAKDELREDLTKNIALSNELASTTIDISYAPLEAQFMNKTNFLNTLQTLLVEAQKKGDLAVVNNLKSIITNVTKEIQKISAKMNN